MKKNDFHKILNPILFVLALNQAFTAILSDEMSPRAFEILHKGGGFIFIAVIAVHFVLNFNWVKANYFTK